MTLSESTIKKIARYCQTHINEWDAKYVPEIEDVVEYETFSEFVERMMTNMVEDNKISYRTFHADGEFYNGLFYAYAYRAEEEYFAGI